MKIVQKEITVRDLSQGYSDDAEGGVTGYGGKLDIRPPFQREFVYKDQQRDAVIDTASKGFPLNVMYWSVRDNGEFEIIDGQQRTISLCQYVHGEFSVEIGSFKEKRAFHNLQDDEQERLLDYPLTVYLCSGTNSEKLEWFKTINIAGEELYPQELRNAVFHGEWVTEAKKYFSRPGCPAQARGSKYLNGSAIRQDYLETAIKWHRPDGNIEKYMDEHKNEKSAQDLWDYFENVIDWVEIHFLKYRKEMKGLPWGPLYERYHSHSFDPKTISEQVDQLYADPFVKNRRGVFEYILGGLNDERLLDIRLFDEATAQSVYAEQTQAAKKDDRSNCPHCAISHSANQKKIWEFSEMDADHVEAWSKGGNTTAKNCQMLCVTHNRAKGNR